MIHHVSPLECGLFEVSWVMTLSVYLYTFAVFMIASDCRGTLRILLNLLRYTRCFFETGIGQYAGDAARNEYASA